MEYEERRAVEVKKGVCDARINKSISSRLRCVRNRGTLTDCFHSSTAILQEAVHRERV